jgi:hypothetical protein
MKTKCSLEPNKLSFFICNLVEEMLAMVELFICMSWSSTMKVSKGKRRMMETQLYFTMQKYNLQKNPQKQTKIITFKIL